MTLPRIDLSTLPDLDTLTGVFGSLAAGRAPAHDDLDRDPRHLRLRDHRRRDRLIRDADRSGHCRAAARSRVAAEDPGGDGRRRRRLAGGGRRVRRARRDGALRCGGFAGGLSRARGDVRRRNARGAVRRGADAPVLHGAGRRAARPAAVPARLRRQPRDAAARAGGPGAARAARGRAGRARPCQRQLQRRRAARDRTRRPGPRPRDPAAGLRRAAAGARARCCSDARSRARGAAGDRGRAAAGIAAPPPSRRRARPDPRVRPCRWPAAAPIRRRRCHQPRGSRAGAARPDAPYRGRSGDGGDRPRTRRWVAALAGSARVPRARHRRRVRCPVCDRRHAPRSAGPARDRAAEATDCGPSRVEGEGRPCLA